MDPKAIAKASKGEYITKLLEFLLKYRKECSEKEDRDLAERESRFVLKYFEEFKERPSFDDIKFQLIGIRELYIKEVLKLRKSGKSGNESNLPWFYEAENLFYRIIDWENEILRDQILSSLSLDDSTVKTSDVALENSQCEPLKLPSLPPDYMLSSSQIAMVTSMAVMTSVSSATTASLPYTVNPLLVDSSEPYAVKQLLVTTAAFPSFNSGLRATKSFTGISKRHVIKTPELLTVGSPFVMNAHSSKIHHPFSTPPTSPTTWIPLWLTTASSTVPLKLNTVFTSAQVCLTPAVISTIDGVNPSSAAVSSNELSSTTPSRSEAPQYLIGTPWTTRSPCPTTLTYSLAKDPIFTTTVSSMDRSPPTSERPEVPLSTIASSSRTVIPILQTALPSSIDTDGSVYPLVRAGHPLWTYKPPPPYTTSVHLPLAATSSRSTVLTSVSPTLRLGILEAAAPSSSTSILTSAAPPSGTGYPLGPYKPPPPYTTSVHLPLTATSSRSNVRTSVSPSLQFGVPKSVTPSSNTSTLASAAPSSKAGHLLWPYKHPPPYTASVHFPAASTYSPIVLTSAFSSSRAKALKKTATSLSGLPILSSNSRLAYSQSVPLSSNVLSYMNRVPLSQNSPSSRADLLASAARASKTNVLKSTAPSFNVGNLTPASTFPSASVFRSSVPSLRTEVSFSQITSTSTTGVPRLQTIPSYRKEAYLVPTASSSRSGNTRISVAPSPNASRFNTGASLITPTTITSLNIPQSEALV